MTEAEKQAETHRLVERSAEIECTIGCPHGRLHEAQRSFDRIARGLRRPDERSNRHRALPVGLPASISISIQSRNDSIGREGTMAPAAVADGGREARRPGVQGRFRGARPAGRRPEGAADRPAAGTARAPPAAPSPQPGAHDDAIREILEAVRATAARIDALQDAPGLKHETAEALEAGQPFGLLQDAGMPTARMDEAGDDNADPTAEAEPAAPAADPRRSAARLVVRRKHRLVGGDGRPLTSYKPMTAAIDCPTRLGRGLANSISRSPRWA